MDMSNAAGKLPEKIWVSWVRYASRDKQHKKLSASPTDTRHPLSGVYVPEASLREAQAELETRDRKIVWMQISIDTAAKENETLSTQISEARKILDRTLKWAHMSESAILGIKEALAVMEEKK